MGRVSAKLLTMRETLQSEKIHPVPEQLNIAVLGQTLAHPNNAPASRGYGYEGSRLKYHANHKVETRLHRYKY